MTTIINLFLFMVILPGSVYLFYRYMKSLNTKEDVRNHANQIAKYNWKLAQQYLDEHYY